MLEVGVDPSDAMVYGTSPTREEARAGIAAVADEVSPEDRLPGDAVLLYLPEIGAAHLGILSHDNPERVVMAKRRVCEFDLHLSEYPIESAWRIRGLDV